ncbi:transcriptional regulator Spx [Levilactobacillus namurensis]|uniref:Transcriptional regulator Spx n=1 Tax=Levilactobacillus namurensis TaxID=380393 RepID=A0AAW8W716_9LACO|nr:transcriptional regulator Spx [Levilactobacillus namurensis]MDT7014186.1 transcriptional regulator Spx [Levilactobacillus namurensis]
MTVTLFTTPSCSSCRKARLWLEDHGIAYREQNIFVTPLKEADIKAILRLTEEGTEEIISKRSQAYQQLGTQLEELPLGDLFDLIRRHPGILRRPIVMDDRRLQVGFNEEEIRRFLPRSVRIQALQTAQRLANGQK